MDHSLSWVFTGDYSDGIASSHSVGSSSSSNGVSPTNSSLAIYSNIHDNHGLTTSIVDNGYTLQCLYTSLDSRDSRGARFTFGAQLLPGLCMNRNKDDSFSVLLACNDNTAHRLSFSKEKGFEELGKDWHKEQQLSQVYAAKTPVACHGMDGQNTLVIAYSDGTLLKVEWSEQEDRFYESELVKEQSFISSVRSFFPSRRRLIAGGPGTPTASPARNQPARSPAVSSVSSSSSAATELVIALASDSSNLHPEFLFTVSRDRKLRAWSTATNTCIETIQLPSTSQTMDIVPVSSTPDELAEEQASSVSLLPGNVRPLVRFIPPVSDRDGASPHLLLYIPTNNVQTSFFILYALSIDDRGNLQAITPISEKPCDFALEASSSCQLCDFQYRRDNGQLWTLWSENGKSVVRYSKLNIETSDALVLQSESEAVGIADTAAWYDVLSSHSQENIPLDVPSSRFDSVLEDAYSSYQATLAESELRPSTTDSAYRLTTLAKQAVVDTFLTHIFYPGRYPTSSISSALYRYVEAASKSAKRSSLASRNDASLAQQALDVVGAQVQVQQDPQTGALMEKEYIKLFKMEWLKLLALAEEGRREAVLPLSLHIGTAKDTVFVLAKGGFACTTTTDAVVRLKELLSDSDAERDVSSLPLESDVAKAQALELFSASATLRRRLDPHAMADFEQAVSAAATSPISVALEDLASEIYETALEPYIDDDLASTLTAALSALQGQSTLAETLTSAFELLSSPNQTRTRDDMEEGHDQQCSSDARHLALSVNYTSQALLARYQLSVHLFLLVLFVQGEMLDPDPSTSMSADEAASPLTEDELSSLLATAVSSIKTFSVGRWLSEHNTAMTDLDLHLHDADNGNSADDLLQKLSSLRMQTGSGNAASPGPSGSVLAVLSRSDNFKSSSASPSSMSGDLLLSTGLLSSSHDLDNEHAAMMVATLKSQHSLSEALALIELIPDKDEDAALLHLRGAVAAERNDMEVAESCFIKVAAAIHTEDPSIAYLQNIIPYKSASDLSSYYRYIVTLLESRDVELSVARFCRLAIRSFQPENADDQPGWLKELWNKEFRCYTAVGHFDAAYACMMGMPFAGAQQDCLRHLVAVMCDSGVVYVLLHYSFIGLHAELEKTLSFRARNSHPLAVPDYYKILFAFHSSRCDYRSAAAIMYQKAKRLASASSETNAVESVTAQCQSYLTSMNSLALVGEDKQWILVDTPSTKRDAPKRKRQRLLDAPIPDPAVVSLGMIRSDYVLSLARLQLSQHFPELNRANKYLDPANAVALFSQIGAFDTALQTALALEVDMSSVFEHLAARCVHLGQSRASMDDEARWLLKDNTATSWEGSLSSKGWRLLELYLSRFDDGDRTRPAGQYRKRVLQTILEEDRRTRLPKFLVNWFMSNHPERLIWKLVEFDLLEEAYGHARTMIAHSASEMQRHTEGRRGAVTHLPYNLLDQLLLVDLEDEIASRRIALESQQKELRGLVEEQHRRLEQQWRQL